VKGISKSRIGKFLYQDYLGSTKQLTSSKLDGHRHAAVRRVRGRCRPARRPT